MHRTHLIFVPLILGVLACACQGQTIRIFDIGTKDGSFSEFVHNHKPEKPVIYRVGESSPDKDWYAYQPGTLDSIVGRSTMQHDWISVPAALLGFFSQALSGGVHSCVVAQRNFYSSSGCNLPLPATCATALRRHHQWKTRGKLSTQSAAFSGTVVAERRRERWQHAIFRIRVIGHALPGFRLRQRKQHIVRAMPGRIRNLLRSSFPRE